MDPVVAICIHHRHHHTHSKATIQHMGASVKVKQFKKKQKNKTDHHAKMCTREYLIARKKPRS